MSNRPLIYVIHSYPLLEIVNYGIVLSVTVCVPEIMCGRSGVHGLLYLDRTSDFSTNINIIYHHFDLLPLTGFFTEIARGDKDFPVIYRSGFWEWGGYTKSPRRRYDMEWGNSTAMTEILQLKSMFPDEGAIHGCHPR